MMYKDLVDNLKDMNLNNSITTACLFFGWDLWKINIEANDVVNLIIIVSSMLCDILTLV